MHPPNLQLPLTQSRSLSLSLWLTTIRCLREFTLSARFPLTLLAKSLIPDANTLFAAKKYDQNGDSFLEKKYNGKCASKIE